jgi:hypothetical protein
VNPATQAGNRGFGSKQGLRGKSSHQNQERGPHELNLLAQMRRTPRHLGGFRVTVSGWAALQYIGDVHIAAAIEPRCDEHRIEQRAGTANKGLAKAIFISARRLPDQHPARCLISRAKHRVLT